MATTEYLKEMRGLIKSTLVATVGDGERSFKTLTRFNKGK
jgi:hypothetical protein